MKKREHWASSFGFIMAALGSAIGLGTLWQFPYMLGEYGGGYFFITYILCTFFIGIPAFIAELVIGRASNKGAVVAFHTLEKKKTSWAVAGWFGVVVSFLILSYYCVVAGWGVSYFFMSLSNSFQGLDPEQIRLKFDVLYRSAQMNLFWQIIFLLMTAFIVHQGVRKGIEHFSKILMPALLILLVSLLIYSMFLEGFMEAMDFIFRPKAGVMKPSTILSALGLAFFTLSVGQGIMITYGSYMEKSSDIPKTALIIGVMDVIVSILCAMMIFPVLFTFGFASSAGFGLVFKSLPIVFAQLPGAVIISAAFFLLFVFTALTSSVALLEAIVATVLDLTNLSRKKAVWTITCFIFLIGVPCALAGSGTLFANWEVLYGRNFFETMVYLVSVWLLPISGLLVILYTGYKFKCTIVREEFQLNSKLGNLFSLWFFLIRYVAPIAIFLILLQETNLIDLDRIFS